MQTYLHKGLFHSYISIIHPHSNLSKEIANLKYTKQKPAGAHGTGGRGGVTTVCRQKLGLAQHQANQSRQLIRSERPLEEFCSQLLRYTRIQHVFVMRQDEFQPLETSNLPCSSS